MDKLFCFFDLYCIHRGIEWNQLEGTSGGLWSNPLLQAGQARAGCLVKFWICARKETLQPLWSPVFEHPNSWQVFPNISWGNTPCCSLHCYVSSFSSICLKPAIRQLETTIMSSLSLLFLHLHNPTFLSCSYSQLQDYQKTHAIVVSVISVSFKQAQFTLTPNSCASVQSCDFMTCFFLLCSIIFDLQFHFLSWLMCHSVKWPSARHFYIADCGQLAVLVSKSFMLIPPPPFSHYVLQKEMWTPDGHPYLLVWGWCLIKRAMNAEGSTGRRGLGGLFSPLPATP